MVKREVFENLEIGLGVKNNVTALPTVIGSSMSNCLYNLSLLLLVYYHRTDAKTLVLGKKNYIRHA